MNTRLRARLSAFVTHLILSGVVIAVFSLVVYLIWYPGPYHIIHSTLDVTKTLIMVDVVLGPLLTLILFDIRKTFKELRRDIGIVVLLQLSALIWGGNIIYKMRPLVAAYHENVFYIATLEDIEPVDRNHSILPAIFEKPKLVYVKPIEDKEERHKFFEQVFSFEKKPLMLQPTHYADIEPYYVQIHDAGRLDFKKISNDPDKLHKLNTFWAEHEGNAEDYCYHEVLSGNFVGTLVMDCEQPIIIGLIHGRL